MLPDSTPLCISVLNTISNPINEPYHLSAAALDFPILPAPDSRSSISHTDVINACHAPTLRILFTTALTMVHTFYFIMSACVLQNSICIRYIF